MSKNNNLDLYGEYEGINLYSKSRKDIDRYTIIWLSIQTHGYTYDYRELIYNNSKDKVTIICDKHGRFKRIPYYHIKGEGLCPECYKEERRNKFKTGELKNTPPKNKSTKKKTTEEFIKDAREVQGDKYDYSNVDYVNSKTEVEIICPIHGSFFQKPNSHLLGRGCPKCAEITRNEKRYSKQDDVIKKFMEKHGDKYDYSKVVYRKYNEPVEIICPKHGSFFMTPISHLSGNGCHKCFLEALGDRNRSNREEFIEKAREVQGDKYDYSKVVYVDSETKVEIICPEHGSFFQRPASHLMGQGCPKCAGLKKLTTEEFIEKAIEIHGHKDDYSDVNYINNRTKVTIICPIHGPYQQTPNQHLSGQGCPYCGGCKKHTTEEFVELARKLNGDNFDYSKVKYVNNKTKVEIICPIHGSFFQTPNQHLRGAGCPYCSKTKQNTTEGFVEDARKVQGDKYDYSKVKYVNNKTKVEIICPIHGSFFQIPLNHLRGAGCPKCNNSTLEEAIRNSLDENNIRYETQKTFDWLKYKSNLFLDFYLPDFNIAIECQGIQHFIPISTFGGKDTIEPTQNRDISKHNKCKENNVELLYFLGNLKLSSFTNLREDVANLYKENVFHDINELINYILKSKRVE